MITICVIISYALIADIMLSINSCTIPLLLLLSYLLFHNFAIHVYKPQYITSILHEYYIVVHNYFTEPILYK